jgi:hypothetical protein
VLEDVIRDLRRMGISGWMEKARNRDQWRWIIEKLTQGCSVKKNSPYSIDIFKIHKRITKIIMNSRNRDL